MRMRRRERLTHVIDRADANELDLGMNQEPSHELGPGKAGTAVDCRTKALHRSPSFYRGPGGGAAIRRPQTPLGTTSQTNGLHFRSPSSGAPKTATRHALSV